MSRGRPRGSVKADRRQRRDYRFSPATMQLIEQGRQRAAMSETAFVEAAIQHYSRVLESSFSPALIENVSSPTENSGTKNTVTQRVTSRKEAGKPETPATVPAAPQSLRQPVYQIYLRHAPDACPDLPEGFDYIDGDRSKGNRRCMHPVHRVYAQPCVIKAAQQRAEALLERAGILSVWIEDRSGEHSWKKENGRWQRNI